MRKRPAEREADTAQADKSDRRQRRPETAAGAAPTWMEGMKNWKAMNAQLRRSRLIVRHTRDPAPCPKRCEEPKSRTRNRRSHIAEQRGGRLKMLATGALYSGSVG